MPIKFPIAKPWAIFPKSGKTKPGCYVQKETKSDLVICPHLKTYKHKSTN